MTVYELVMRGADDDSEEDVSFGLFATEERVLAELIRRGPDFGNNARWRIVPREVTE